MCPNCGTANDAVTQSACSNCLAELPPIDWSYVESVDAPTRVRTLHVVLVGVLTAAVWASARVIFGMLPSLPAGPLAAAFAGFIVTMMSNRGAVRERREAFRGALLGDAPVTAAAVVFGSSTELGDAFVVAVGLGAFGAPLFCGAALLAALAAQSLREPTPPAPPVR